MTCQEFDNALPEMLESGADRSARTHADGCDPCRERLESQEQLSVLLRAAGRQVRRVDAPAEVEATLLAEFRVRHRQPAAGRWAWAAAAAVLFASAAATLLTTPDAARLARHAPAAARLHERTTEFFALPYSAMPAGDSPSRLIRVELPRMALARFGLPIDERRLDQPVQADVLLGEDSLAQAIRFVYYEQPID